MAEPNWRYAVDEQTGVKLARLARTLAVIALLSGLVIFGWVGLVAYSWLGPPEDWWFFARGVLLSPPFLGCLLAVATIVFRNRFPKVAVAAGAVSILLTGGYVIYVAVGG